MIENYGDFIQKIKFIGGVDFDELRAQRVQLYNKITIDLNTARINQEYTIVGNYVYGLEATDVDANLDLRFNEKFRESIPIREGRGVRVPFYRFYVTNPAQVGKTLTLAIGIESDTFEIFDVGKALGITGTVDTNQVGGSAEQPAGSVQVAKSDVVVATTTVLHTVTAGKKLYLSSGTLHVYINTGTVAGEGKLFVTDDGDVEQYFILDLVFYADANAMVQHDTWNTYPPLEIPAGYKVKLYATGTNCTAYGFIHGYEK